MGATCLMVGPLSPAPAPRPTAGTASPAGCAGVEQRSTNSPLAPQGRGEVVVRLGHYKGGGPGHSALRRTPALLMEAVPEKRGQGTRDKVQGEAQR